MSVSIAVAWACECNPPYVTGHYDGDKDRIVCYRCSGIIEQADSINLDTIQKWNKEYERETGIKL